MAMLRILRARRLGVNQPHVPGPKYRAYQGHRTPGETPSRPLLPALRQLRKQRPQSHIRLLGQARQVSGTDQTVTHVFGMDSVEVG